MRTCLIFGQNGLDLDVCFNIRSFYGQLGFAVYYSNKLYDADVLVVLRAVDEPVDLSPFNFSVVHVFDYGGWDYNGFVNSIAHQNVYIFCTSAEQRSRLLNNTRFPEAQAFVALPPVTTSIWTKKLKKTAYNAVHIGNYKPIQEKDELKDSFQKALIDQHADIWGMNWEAVIDKRFYHGKAAKFAVSGIYSKAVFSFGFMYPFQRPVTFSGRFWHAPLNGCQLFSEPGLFSNQVPGVIETDYSTDDLAKKMSSSSKDRAAVQENALAYWTKESDKTKALVTASLSNLKKGNSIKKFKNYLSVLPINKAAYLYHVLKG